MIRLEYFTEFYQIANSQQLKAIRFRYVKLALIISLLLIVHNSLFAQQLVDTTYNPVIHHTEYGYGKGPVVFIDEDIIISTQKMADIRLSRIYWKEMAMW